MSGAPDARKAEAAAAADRLVSLADQLVNTKLAQEHLEAERQQLNAEAAELIHAYPEIDGTMFVNPVIAEKQVLKLREDDYLATVDLDALRAWGGQQAVDAVIGPPKVQSARFERAVEAGLIPVEVAAQVAVYKTKRAYLSFVAPDDGSGATADDVVDAAVA